MNGSSGVLFALLAFGVAVVAIYRASEAVREAKSARIDVEALREYLTVLHAELERRATAGRSGASPSTPAKPVETAVEAPRVAAEPAAPRPGPSELVDQQPVSSPVTLPSHPLPVPRPTAAANDSAGRAVALSPSSAFDGDRRSAVASEGAENALEQRLGARLPIWLGAIALALAGIFLVQYTIERGWLTPGRRVGLALAFGVVLLGLSERFHGRSARIGHALAAAGVADLYAALLAGVRLYELIPAWLGFGLMAANTALAVALSLRHGPLPAILGLAGGFLTPALIGLDGAGRAGSLVYLLLLDVGLLAAARRRRWPALAAGALGGTFLWVAVSMLPGATRFGTTGLSLFLLASAALFALSTLRAGATEEWGAGEAPHALALAAGLGTIVLLAALVGRSGFDALEWGFFALLLVGSLVLAAFDEEEYFLLAVAAPVAAGAALVAWGVGLPGDQLTRFLTTSAGLAALTASFGYWALSRSSRPSRWAALTGAAALSGLALAALFARAVGDTWLAVGAALVAVLLAAATAGALARRETDEEPAAEVEEAASWLAAASSLAVACALAFTLDREWLSIGLAAESAALVLLRGRVALPALSRLGGAAFAAAVVRLTLNPEVLRYPIGPLPQVNWLLWGHGLPCALGFWAAARLRRLREQSLAVAFEAGAIAILAAGATLQAWQIASPGEPVRALGRGELWVWSLQTVAWLGLAVGLLLAARGGERPARAVGGRLLAALGGFCALAIHGVAYNPAWSPQAVGALPIVNWLLFYFGLPLVLLLWIAAELERAGDRGPATLARGAATVLGFLLVTLEVRQQFRGSDLAAGEASSAENFAYSATWALLGTLLLLVGLSRRSRGLRLAALAVMAMATLKVFLYDASGLTGLLRVLSFLGLGTTLLLLAWLYQRFVIRDAPES